MAGLWDLLAADWVWIVINIVLPVMLPVLGLWLMRVSLVKSEDDAARKQALAARRYVMLFKDGQLGWVALLMCFTALSEFVEGLTKHKKAAPDWTALFFLVVAFTILSAGVFAANGAVDSIKVIEAKTLLKWIRYYGVAFWSMVLTVIAAVALSVAHFWAAS